MNTETVIKRKAGRPALGNVLFAKRVSPAVAKELEDLVSRERGPRSTGEAPDQSGAAYSKALGDKVKEIMTTDLKQAMELAGVKKQLEEMTASYVKECEKSERLELELVAANQELDTCLAMTEDEKVRYWRDRAFRAEAAIKAKSSEFDQTQ